MTQASTRSVIGLVAVVVGSVAIAAQVPPPGAAEQFYTAIRSRDGASLEALVKSGADVNVHDRRGGATPLMHAAAVGSVDTMTRLIDGGADVNARSGAGATALMWAVADIDKVRLLLTRGADVNAASESGRTALMLAAMSDRSADLVRLLLQSGADPKARDHDNMTTIVAASIGNDTETIRQLVALGIDVNAAPGGDTTGTTALMNAAAYGNTDAVRLLLAAGANVNAVSSPPNQPVKNGTVALGRFTPLILAAAQAPVSTVRTLLDAGAGINAQEARGMTPLIYAAASDHSDLETVRLLLAKGANTSIETVDHETAMDWASKSGPTPVVALLKQAGLSAKPMPAHAAASAAPVAHRAAVERSVALLDRMSGTFFVNGACGACHAQNATDIAIARARQGGIAVNEGAAAQRQAGAAGQFGGTAPRLLERFDGPVVDILLYAAAGFAAAGHPADRATDAIAFNVAAQQSRDGSWHIGGVVRPPIEDGDFSRTALAIRALAVYGTPGRRPEMKARIDRALPWIVTATPRTTEDATFRLLGLKWAGTDRSTIDDSARALAALQRTDGGWGQRPEMPSDAYATGTVLFALLESGGVTASNDQVRRGRDYLLTTQRADGSWYVRSRSPKFQPYFDGGFPYEHDQWISAMATGWSTAALAAALGDAPKAVAAR